MSDASLNEELLSALVDGELTGADRSRAEKLLAENPQLQHRLQQWRRQASLIRKLPQYQLDDEFAARVLQTLSSESSTAQFKSVSSKSVPLKSVPSSSNWRASFAAIATLAAMLLVTLFVFPQTGSRTRVAVKENVKLLDVSPENDALGRVDFEESQTGGIANNLGVDPAVSSKIEAGFEGHLLADKLDPSGQDLTRMELREHAANEFFSGSGIPAARTMDSKPSPARPLSGVAADAPVARKNALGDASESIVMSGKPGNSSDGERVQSDEQRPDVVQPHAAVNQIFFVEFRSHNQPLEAVAEVFARNQIQIFESNGNELSNLAAEVGDRDSIDEKKMVREDQPRSKTATLGMLTNQSESGLEALYVVSTPSQMEQAIQELSDQASIANYQVPQSAPKNEVQLLAQPERLDAQFLPNEMAEELESQPSGAGSETSMEQWIEAAQSKSQPAETRQQDRLDQPRNAESFGLVQSQRAGAGETTETAHLSSSASAQQLRPYEFGNRGAGRLRYSAKSDYSIQSPDALFLKIAEPDAEMVQYLLLIRTQPGAPPVAAAPADGVED